MPTKNPTDTSDRVLSVYGSSNTVDLRQEWEFRFTGEIEALKRNLDAGMAIDQHHKDPTRFRVIFPGLKNKAEAGKWVETMGGKLIVTPNGAEKLLGPR